MQTEGSKSADLTEVLREVAAIEADVEKMPSAAATSVKLEDTSDGGKRDENETNTTSLSFLLPAAEAATEKEEQEEHNRHLANRAEKLQRFKDEVKQAADEGRVVGKGNGGEDEGIPASYWLWSFEHVIEAQDLDRLKDSTIAIRRQQLGSLDPARDTSYTVKSISSTPKNGSYNIVYFIDFSDGIRSGAHCGGMTGTTTSQ